jgi:hypothetical protein
MGSAAEEAMSEMVERVARALHAQYHGAMMAGGAAETAEVAWKRADASGDHDQWRAEARAAIEAMREPTDAMIEAAVTADAAEPIHFGAHEAIAMWRAMIDAAVKNA